MYGCAGCWVWGLLCPLTSAAGAVTVGAATAMPAGAGGPPAPATVHGVPGVAWRAWCAWCAWRALSYALSGDFLSSGCRRRSASGGFDWRDVAQVAVPFACGLFSSVGKFYRSSSV